MQSSVYTEMTDIEKIDCAINKLRVFGSTTYVPGISEICKGLDKTLVVADSNALKNYVSAYIRKISKDLPDLDRLVFSGYFVDMTKNVYIKNAPDAITEIARRIEQVYIYNNTKGNLLPSEYMDEQFLYKLAEMDIEDFKYESLLPVMFRLYFKDGRKTIIKLCPYGQNLLPYVVTDKKGCITLKEMTASMDLLKEFKGVDTDSDTEELD